MALDVAVLLPLFGIIFLRSSTLAAGLLLVAFLMLTAFSALPFGVAEGALLGALIVVRYFLSVFDTDSYIGRSIVLVLGIFSYALFITLLHGAFIGWRIKIFAEGGVFFFRQFFLGFTLWLGGGAVLYSYSWIRYAFLE